MSGRTVFACCMILVASSVAAYEPQNHRRFTEAAVAASVLGDPSAAERRDKLGLKRATNPRSRYINSKDGVGRSLIDLIGDGAVFEDDGHRALNHFFNPSTLSPLRPTLSSGLAGFTQVHIDAISAVAATSPDWTLGTHKGINYPFSQEFSYQNFKDYLFDGITNKNLVARQRSLAKAFQTLGHMTHHLQDMAQPQHVRNDAHVYDSETEKECGKVYSYILDPTKVLACTGYNLMRNPSFYEQWTLEISGQRTLPLGGYPVIFGGSSPDGSWINTPRQLWLSSGRGMADYTAANFYSSGTMQQAPPHLETPFVESVGKLCNSAIPACGPIDPAQVVTFWPSPIEDRLLGKSEVHPYAASASIFTPDFKAYAVLDVAPPRTVNRFTYEHHYVHLLPRAVAYSAGLINFVLRGSLELREPAEGVFAIRDMSVQDCGADCGFEVVKARVRNTTPNEEVGAGALYLVASYRRNVCFHADLSGEDGGSQFTGDSCRTGEEFVAVSRPVKLSSIGREWSDSIKFEFDQPKIPIRASDLDFRLIYRGALGAEDGAIMISARNVSEPNYVAVGNVTDYVFYDGDDKYAPLKAGESPIVLNAVTFSFQDPGSAAPPLATLSGLTGGQHAQFAFITTKEPRNYWLRTQSYPPFGHTDNAPFRVEEFFKDDDDATSTYARTCKVVLERGRYRQYVMYYAQTAHGRISEAAPDGAEPSAVHPADDRGVAKYASDCRGPVPPGANGMFDFSYLTPYTNNNAKSWTINFP